MGARWCADSDLLGETITAGLSLPRLSAPLRLVLEAAERRLAFRRALGDEGLDRLTVLSLGGDCLPFDLPTRYGLGCLPERGPAVTPFALAVHAFDEVIRLI